MNGQTKTLALIAAFIVLMLGSFIWFVVTWDAEKEQPVSALAQPEVRA